MMAWLVPTIGYVFVLAAMGITSKYALRTLAWQELIPWAMIAYVVCVAAMLAARQTRITFSGGAGWAAAAGFAAVGSLALLYIALSHGDAGKVVPVSAAYPAVTLAFSVIFLSERLTAGRIGGTVLVVAGVALISSGN
jgi:bacterial/archaeal transporter family protein